MPAYRDGMGRIRVADVLEKIHVAAARYIDP
jgi:hypothetical protein